ncbi:MAG: hypothetical protein PHN29_06715 [Endomicrobiaceae bacterium]|nr:hypothetical protein [Endomicrobiaceae bacterium]
MKINLNGKWTLSGPCLKNELTVAVPGSVYMDFLQNGLIGDPHYRDNDRELLALMNYDYHYSRTFVLKEEDLAKQIELVFLGLDTIGEIYLNGKLVGKTYNMHRRYRFSVNRYLDGGENHLKVVLKSCLKFMAEKAKTSSYQLMQMDATVKNYPYIRKAHAMFGWDWGPQLPDAGIWRDVYLELTAGGRIKDVFFFQDTNQSQSQVQVKIKNELLKPCKLELKLMREGRLVYQKKTAAKSENTITFTVSQPELWYPTGYGAAALYRLEVILASEGKEVAKRALTVGFRKVKIIRETDEYGESFKFNINDIDVFIKGANYIIEDNLMPRMSRERTESLIRAAVDANHNAIRVWGGGIYPPDYFYELCDRYGLVIWQDLMFACAYYDMADALFRREIKAEINDNIKRIRNHPALVLICGNNENEVAVTWNPPDIAAAKRHYREQYEAFIPSILEKVAPDIYYWPSSPSSGGGFDAPNSERRGDVHYWDVWHGNKPITAYRDITPRFLSEFGLQSFPSAKTICAFSRPEERNAFSYVMTNHQRCPDGNQKIIQYIGQLFRFPQDFSSLVYLSQITQAEAIRIGVEHLRRNYPRSMGSLYWQLNDCWPGITWSSIDCFGRYKALHYFSKHFYRPVLLSLQEDSSKHKVDIYITNEKLKAITGNYRWRLIDLKGQTRRESAARYRVGALRAEKLATVSFSLSEEELKGVIFVAEAQDDDGSVYRNHVAFVPDKYLELEKPQLSFTLAAESDDYRLTVLTDRVVKFLEISAINRDIIFSDNYFFLYPLQEKVITWHSDEKITLADLQFRSLVDTY